MSHPMIQAIQGLFRIILGIGLWITQDVGASPSMSRICEQLQTACSRYLQKKFADKCLNLLQK